MVRDALEISPSSGDPLSISATREPTGKVDISCDIFRFWTNPSLIQMDNILCEILGESSEGITSIQTQIVPWFLCWDSINLTNFHLFSDISKSL